ncbi:hypothetical protein J437_LFUL017170 [Ladona fulva]|uniref:UV radiation resistance-associated gene protein n=1 Tax=Ladona fulva TaxID=123851 RepID=A0A8K0KM86_LADFU|nr:hypothetical protein J437_LFUL017170 [Ladona fulva]
MANLRQNTGWQDFVPLFSQQCRLRHLIRITAFNVGSTGGGKSKETKRINTQCSPSHSTAYIDSLVSDVCVYYYTLHLTTMSAPFYKSEKVQGENPRWAELEMKDIMQESASVVIRIWKHRQNDGGDTLVTAWGVYFSGLVPIPMVHSTLTLPSSVCLGPNTIVFHMQDGACFTSPHCIHRLEGKEDEGAEKCSKSPRGCAIFNNLEQRYEFGTNGIISKKSGLCLADSEVRSSYTLPLLLRLRTVEHAIRKQAASAGALRERISAASVLPSSCERNSKGSSRRKDDSQRAGYSIIGSQTHSSPTAVTSSRFARRQALAQALMNTESLRLCVSILKGERGRKLSEIRVLGGKVQELVAQNKERGKELKEQQECLAKEIEHLREWRHREFLEARDAFLHTSAHLAFRRRQLVSELSLIYPIQQHPNGGYTICNVKLPNSEDFGPRDEVMVSVALGYVAHAVQMISIFLHVPLRYPVLHLGSRSRIMDLVADKIPDGEREFPLFSRAKDKLQFKYGVYLLNKNVAQLRWYCGLPTQDLRATLPNLASLIYPKSGAGSIVNSGSISNIIGSNTNGPAVHADQSSQGHPQGHRRTHSGSSPTDRVGSTYESLGSGELQPVIRPFERGHRDETDIGFKGSNLSYSLDKGLDEYEVINRVCHHKRAGERELSSDNGMERQLSRVNSALAVDSSKSASLGHVSSDPLLGNIMASDSIRLDTGDSKEVKPSTEARRQFLHGWQLSGAGAPGHSDEESAMASDDTVQHSSPQILCPLPSSKDGSQRTNNNNVSMNVRISTLLPAEKMAPSLVATSTTEVDRLFASVASRTEALASRSTSFNLVRSRQGSTTEDGGVS